MVHAGTERAASERELGFRSILAYKTGKAIVQIGLALVLGMLLPFGLPDWLASFTVKLRHRFVQGLSLRLVDLLAWGATPHRLDLTVGALSLDGALTGVEVWALRHDFWWAAWLVAVLTSALLPFEVLELYRHRHLMRVALLAANLVVAGYLVRRAWLHRAARRHPPPG